MSEMRPTVAAAPIAASYAVCACFMPASASAMFAAPGSPWNHVRCLPGAYVVPSCDITVEGALTSTTPVSAYRGAGRPEGNYFMERLIDTAASEMGLDPAALRRRNLIGAAQLPWTTPIGTLYDSGDFPALFARALEAADWKGYGARLRRSVASGCRRTGAVGMLAIAVPQLVRHVHGAVDADPGEEHLVPGFRVCPCRVSRRGGRRDRRNRRARGRTRARRGNSIG